MNNRTVNYRVEPTLPKEDSTEAAIAALLSEASTRYKEPPLFNNVPASSDIDIKNSISTRCDITQNICMIMSLSVCHGHGLSVFVTHCW